jgi:putative zinc finger/helix-turn-helix YgiT family protein
VACRAKELRPATVSHTTEVRHEGRLYTVHVPQLHVLKCGACGEFVLDDRANDQIYDALREQLGLLSPATIRSERNRLGLMQRQLAAHLGVAEETISRWENGMVVQSKAMDKLLRLYFRVAEARQFLADEEREQFVREAARAETAQT